MFLTRSERHEYRLYRKNRRRRKLAFAVAVALVLTAAALVHHTPAQARHLKDKATARTTGTPAKTPSTRAPATAGASASLNWIDFHGIELPVSAQDGPHHSSGGLAWGFNDTRLGSVLAAVNIVVRTAAQWGPAIYLPTIRNQVTGPGASAMLKTNASEYAALRSAARVRPGEPAGRGYAVEGAYRVEAYAPTTAKVAIVTEGPGAGGATVMVVTPIDVAWLHGDWRVVAPRGGDWAASATTASSMTGYTTFPDER